MWLKLKLIWEILSAKRDPSCVYFASAISGGNNNLETVKELIKFIKEDCGKQVLSEHLIEENHRKALAENAGVHLNKDGDLDDFTIEETDMKWLREAGFTIVEFSNRSTGTGREIGESRWLAKPVLCLFRRESNASPMITGMLDSNGNRKYPNVWIAEYWSIEDAKITIAAFLNGQLA